MEVKRQYDIYNDVICLPTKCENSHSDEIKVRQSCNENGWSPKKMF